MNKKNPDNKLNVDGIITKTVQLIKRSGPLYGMIKALIVIIEFLFNPINKKSRHGPVHGTIMMDSCRFVNLVIVSVNVAATFNNIQHMHVPLV